MKQTTARGSEALRSLDARWAALAAVALFGFALLALFMFRIADDSIAAGDPAFVTAQPAGDGGLRSSEALAGTPGSAPAGDTPGRRLGERLVLAPHVIQGRLAGYAIAQESDSAVLSSAKLRVGDILVEVDGRPLDAARVRGLGDELSVADSIQVTYQRAGQLRSRVIEIAG